MIYKAFLNRQEIEDFPINGVNTDEIYGGDTLLWKKSDDSPKELLRIFTQFTGRDSDGNSYVCEYSEAIMNVSENGNYSITELGNAGASLVNVSGSTPPWHSYFVYAYLLFEATFSSKYAPSIGKFVKRTWQQWDKDGNVTYEKEQYAYLGVGKNKYDGYYSFLSGFGSSLKMVGCPSGGSAQKYFLRSYRKGGNPEILDEYGSGISIGSFKESESNIAIIVKSGATVNNLIFKPMLTTDTTATYADFEPYTGGIPSPNPDYPQEIKSVVNPTVKVCAKNLYTYHDSISNFAGIKITRDGSNITLDGTANANGPEDANKVLRNVFLKKGTYTLSYNIESGSKTLVGDNLFRLSTNKNFSTKFQVFIKGTNNAATFTMNEDDYASVICRVNSGSVYNNCKFNIQIEKGSTQTLFEPYHEQTVTIPYTLNAIPVNSGGNVTIDGQQYIADYVDVERGKLVRNVLVKTFTGNEGWDYSDATDDSKKRFYLEINKKIKSAIGISNYLRSIGADIKKGDNCFVAYTRSLDVRITSIASLAEFKSFLARLDSNGKPLNVLFALDTPEEIDLTQEEISAFKALSTNYPVTNIEVSSDQLDGYTVFNYPISMANGWNYVKKQLNDNRDYIYDMDMQSAEAYVNSEYAVALTELEV